MHPDETFIYSLNADNSISSLYIYIFYADNGTEAVVKEISTAKCDSEKWVLTAGNGNFVYGTLKSNNANEIYAFAYEYGSDRSHYFDITSNHFAIAFSWLKDKEVFICFLPSDTNQLIMARADFNTLTYSWYKLVSCSESSWSTGRSRIAYNSDADIIYFCLLQNSKIKFLIIDAAGASTSNIHI